MQASDRARTTHLLLGNRELNSHLAEIRRLRQRCGQQDDLTTDPEYFIAANALANRRCAAVLISTESGPAFGQVLPCPGPVAARPRRVFLHGVSLAGGRVAQRPERLAPPSRDLRRLANERHALQEESISAVMRAFLLEHEIALAQESINFVGGSSLCCGDTASPWNRARIFLSGRLACAPGSSKWSPPGSNRAAYMNA